jgi:YgjP-like, metallopeptidase domain
LGRTKARGHGHLLCGRGKGVMERPGVSPCPQEDRARKFGAEIQAGRVLAVQGDEVAPEDEIVANEDGQAQIWMDIVLLFEVRMHHRCSAVRGALIDELHLIEKKHNEKFVNLMTEYLPKWRSVKEDLNRFLLSHEEWNY